MLYYISVNHPKHKHGIPLKKAGENKVCTFKNGDAAHDFLNSLKEIQPELRASVIAGDPPVPAAMTVDMTGKVVRMDRRTGGTYVVQKPDDAENGIRRWGAPDAVKAST